ncbi:hypothetical protein [Enterococcus thailandicus]|uniref:hypothetical protein n=1 Tax=Enterococcus thailandicus TaxID=417368 RepID=UPI0025535D1E|nr:hypothetical protein [Enterococcus thailandicus]
MKKTKISLYLLLIFMCIQTEASFAATNSVIIYEVTTGELSMSVPNDVSVTADLTNKDYVMKLDNIQTVISDYRGIPNGYILTLKSPNYREYNQNYQLIVNYEQISEKSSVVFSTNKQIMNKKIKLLTKAKILATAKTGFYAADLEWSVQPNIENALQE